MIITIEEFVNVINKAKSNSIISLRYKTNVKTKKKDLFHDRIVRINEIKGEINFNYEKLMQESNEDFKATGKGWGKKEPGKSIIENKDQKYLQVRVLENISTKYLVDGEPVDFENIKEHLPQKNSSGNSSNAEDKKIIRVYNISNIKAATVDDVLYNIVS